MSEFFPFLADWPFISFALTAAAGFYLVVAFGTSHLPDEKQAHLSLWLQGDYDSTWTAQYGAMFDRIFGARHWHPRCILLSALFSVVTVLALWVFFDRVLDLQLRVATGLSLTEALILGALINIVPDWLSLWETRWLLRAFERVRHPLGQAGVLILDAVATGAIIWSGIQAYLWWTGKPALSVVEIAGLFSIYAVFFYSTFLTSVWAWLYCLASWLVRLSSGLKNWLDVQRRPGRALALLGAVFVFVGTLAIKPLLTMDERGRIPLDNFLCATFPGDACKHLALLSQACPGGATEECMGPALKLFGINPEDFAPLWEKACEGGHARSCTNLGILHEKALGVPQDYDKARALFARGCDGGDARGCTNLGVLHEKALGGPQDYARARALYTQGCEGGHARGCTNLGIVHGHALGVPRDYTKARALYAKGCKGGDAVGCTGLGTLHLNARGGPQDYARARALYTRGCEGGDALGCTNLGYLHHNALGVPQDYARARTLYTQGCEGGAARGCTNLGVLHEQALGGPQDYARARALYTQGCEGGDALACANLGILHENAHGGPEDLGKANRFYGRACDMGGAWGCYYLGWNHQDGIGVDPNPARALVLYDKACTLGLPDACARAGALRAQPR